jgi:hypothetical protein
MSSVSLTSSASTRSRDRITPSGSAERSTLHFPEILDLEVKSEIRVRVLAGNAIGERGETDACFGERGFRPKPPDDVEDTKAAVRASTLGGAIAGKPQRDPELGSWRGKREPLGRDADDRRRPSVECDFEPTKNEVDLTDEERFHGYHNPCYGDYRLASLSNGLEQYASDASGWQRRCPEGPGARGPERDRA